MKHFLRFLEAYLSNRKTLFENLDRFIEKTLANKVIRALIAIALSAAPYVLLVEYQGHLPDTPQLVFVSIVGVMWLGLFLYLCSQR